MVTKVKLSQEADAARSSTLLQAIDNEGVIVGNYVNSKNENYGFVDIGGKFTTFNDPNAAEPGGTAPIGTPPSLCPST